MQYRKLLSFLTLAFCSLSSVAQNINSSDSLISFIGVGDIMLGTRFPSEQYLPPNNDPLPYVHEAIPYLKDADFTMGNLETSLLDEGDVVKKCSNPDACYAFKMPESYAPILKEMGFDFFNLANNHIRDFGVAGLSSTKYHMQQQGFAWAGLIEKPTATVTVKGQKVGVASFSPNTGTPDINKLSEAISTVKNLANTCDIVIVSFHGGAEGSKHQHVPRKKEIFYGENRSDVYQFAHAMVDAGADIVFGHGPHVTRAIEVYNNRFIAYSLGNFATYSRFNLSYPNSLSPIIKVYTNSNGEFVKGKIIPFKQIKSVSLSYDSSNSVIKKIKDLTQQDFPELTGYLLIEDNGDFSMPLNIKLKAKGLNKLKAVEVDTKKLAMPI